MTITKVNGLYFLISLPTSEHDPIVCSTDAATKELSYTLIYEELQNTVE